MRVSAPPFVAPCYFGTDIPDREELIACHHSLEEICRIADYYIRDFGQVLDGTYKRLK